MNFKEAKAIARLHFHPNITKEDILRYIDIDDSWEFGEYFYSPEFNIKLTVIVVVIKFTNYLEINIKCNKL